MAQHGEPEAPESLKPDTPEDALSGILTPEGHRTWARVYFADTDFSGVVYHARYLEFLERGRSDFLRLAGVEHGALASGNEKMGWVVRRMDILFHRPARIDDVLVIDTATGKVSGARMVMRQRIRRSGVLLVEASVEVALLGSDGKPRRLPAAWVRAFRPAPASDTAP